MTEMKKILNMLFDMWGVERGNRRIQYCINPSLCVQCFGFGGVLVEMLMLEKEKNKQFFCKTFQYRFCYVLCQNCVEVNIYAYL